MKTDRTRTLPAFFTQVIGSLPRPKVVLDLLARQVEMPAQRFTEVMNEMVIFAIRLQEQAGLDVVSDGEWRRRHYVGEFLRRVGGFQRVRKFQHQGETKLTDVVVGKMSAPEPVFRGDAEFLVRNTDRCTKFALPSPFLIAIRYWHADYSAAAYPPLEHVLAHLSEILAAEARAIAGAGAAVI